MVVFGSIIWYKYCYRRKIVRDQQELGQDPLGKPSKRNRDDRAAIAFFHERGWVLTNDDGYKQEFLRLQSRFFRRHKA